VISDEQAHDSVPGPRQWSNGRPRPSMGYMINVASFKNGVGYGKWTHIDGWSESVVDYIRMLEQAESRWVN
jgi:60 kDa SS-A/Ro ribonucleoprotein